MLAPRIAVLLSVSALIVVTSTPDSLAAEKAVASADSTVWTSSDDNRAEADRLRLGDTVTVYEQHNGLAAIEPPLGSTSMVTAAAVKLDSEGARIIRSTHSWACDKKGKRVSPSIELQPGESLLIIGRVEEPDASVWWRIAPPSGEFRWVSTRDLRFANRETAIEELKPLASAIPLTAIEPAEAELTAIAHEAPTDAPRDADAVSYATRLTAIELALSTIVTTPAESWRLGPIRAEADAIVREADSQSDRQHATDLVERIERFAKIADRANRSYQVAPPVQQTKAFQSAQAEEKALRSGYDAVGRLRPVVSKNENAPGYAVVGPDGKLLTLITPEADLDLKPLLGKRVGLNGAKGFIPRYGKPHLTAERVRVLR